MEKGRPKAQIPRTERLNMRFSKFEYEKISKIAEKLNITKTEAVLRGIDLLIAHKPKKYKNISGKNQKQSSANVAEEVVMFDKK